jgi:CMP-N,N'-diacetyllegionaminic acid synthase
MIAWTIDAARAAASLGRIIVSTDDEAIAEVARACGAETPFLRPAEFARDDTSGVMPVIHAVNWLAEHDNYKPDLVMCLQPTSPLRFAADIDAAVSLMRDGSADSVVSIVAADRHPLWMKSIDAAGYIHDYRPGETLPARRQELPPVYALNGAVYLTRAAQLLERGSWYGERTVGYIMPAERSTDVDSMWDLHIVDLIMRDQARRNHG